MSKPHIGSRWPTGPVIRVDTKSGHFESINQVHQSKDANMLQDAFLRDKKPRVSKPWLGIVIYCLIAIGVAVYYGLKATEALWKQS